MYFRFLFLIFYASHCFGLNLWIDSVLRVITNGNVFQLLRAIDLADGGTYIVKVLSRDNIDMLRLASEYKWMTTNEQFSEM